MATTAKPRMYRTSECLSDTHRPKTKVTQGSHTQKVKKYFRVITQDSAGTCEPIDAIAPPTDMRIPPRIRGVRVRKCLQPCSINLRFNWGNQMASQMVNAERKRQSDRLPKPPRSGRYSVSPMVRMAQPSRA